MRILQNDRVLRMADRLLAPTLLALSALATVAVGYDLVGPGPLQWHLTQPASVHGGAEALILLAALALAAWSDRTPFALLAVLAGLFFLRRHNAELTLLVGVAYVEILIAIGTTVARAGGAATWGIDRTFVLGLGCWTLASLALSVAGQARPGVLAVLLLATGAAAMLGNRRSPVSVRLWRVVRTRSAGDRVVAALLLGWFLVLAARTANVVPHDANWYLAHGDRLLAPNGSVFEHLGLVSAVHYFPKLWETLLLPLMVFDQLRVLEGFSLAVLALLLLLAWKVSRGIGLQVRWRWWLLWLLATLPAIANTALSLKTDLLCGVLLVAMCVQLQAWFQHREGGALLLAAAAGALAGACKLTAIPYVGIALLFLVAFEVWHRRQVAWTAPSAPKPGPAGWLALVVCIAAAAALHARTWLLAGVPTIGPDPLLTLWHLLGFELKPPAGTLDWTRPQVWSDVPRLLHEWLLAPSGLPKIRISWTGNVWAVFGLCAGLAALAGIRPGIARGHAAARGLLLGLALTGLALALAWRYHSRGSDGNYFLFPVLIATCLAMTAVSSRAVRLPRCRTALAAVSMAFGLFHAANSFVTTAWSPPGTRSMDLLLDASPLQAGEWKRRQLKSLGLERVAEVLAMRPRDERLVAHMPDQLANALPVRVENLYSIQFSRPGYTATAGHLFEYMRAFDVRHLLIGHFDRVDRRSEDMHAQAVARGWTVRPDRGGVLYTDPTLGP